MKLNPLFGEIWNGKHEIKRRSCSQTSSNHWYSELSYLGVSLEDVVMRPQENISALWLCTDHECEHGRAATGQNCAFWQDSTVLSLENREVSTIRCSLPWQYICHVLSHFLFVVLVMKLLLPFRSAV